MELTGIAVLFIVLGIAIVINRLLRNYLISRALKNSYDEKMRRLLTDPNAQPKGRYD